MKAQRIRPSQISRHAIRSVGLADAALSFPEYSGLLTERYELVRSRTVANAATADPLSISQAVSGLVCGRLAGKDDADAHLYKRAYYCRVTRLCPCCRSLRNRDRAKNMVNDIARNRGMKLLSLLFTMPSPQSETEEVEYLRLARHKAIPAIVKALAAWKRMSKNESRGAPKYRRGHYVIGVHVKKSDSSPYLWTHIHLAVFVDRKCKLKSEEAGILPYLREAFAHAIDLAPVPRCDVRNLGILQWSQISEKTRIEKHRHKTVTLSHSEHSFSYVMRTTEDNDTPTIVKRRDGLFRQAGVGCSYVSSRSPTSQKTDLPHEFAGDRLDKPGYVFPFHGVEPTEYAAGEYQQAYVMLRQQAEQEIHSWFSP